MKTSGRVYDTALYLRLSKEDKDIGGGRSKIESNSIGSQRELLRAYVQEHRDLQIYDIYIDDGYSGADFNRPEFKRMMEDIHAARVNCVIVKDLSRLGRDYIEAGRLIQKTFPAFHVRFIAVTDGYDSLLADKTEQTLVLPVKNFVNDSYCRDISMKVKAHQRVKRLEGKCISAFTVYGYCKNPDDKNQLVPDSYAAGIVRRIFLWKIAGMSLSAIADKLNTFGILSPMEYKRALGMKYSSGFEGAGTARWSAVSVKRILTNRVYVGDMEQGKQEKISYKLKKRVMKPQEEWIRVKNTHEAVISEIDFYLVQELLRCDARASAGTAATGLFSGILMCADCRTPMIRRVYTYKGKKKVFYICQTKNRASGCSRHSIGEEVLRKLVLKEIKWWLERMASGSEIMDTLSGLEVSYEQTAEYDAQIDLLTNEYNRYYGLKCGLPADLEEGMIDQEEFEQFDSLYTKRCEELERMLNGQRALMKQMRQSGREAAEWLERYRNTKDIGELTRELLVIMVSRVYVHEDKRIDIVFRFASEQFAAGGSADGENGKQI